MNCCNDSDLPPAPTTIGPQVTMSPAMLSLVDPASAAPSSAILPASPPTDVSVSTGTLFGLTTGALIVGGLVAWWFLRRRS